MTANESDKKAPKEEIKFLVDQRSSQENMFIGGVNWEETQRYIAIEKLFKKKINKSKGIVLGKKGINVSPKQKSQ